MAIPAGAPALHKTWMNVLNLCDPGQGTLPLWPSVSSQRKHKNFRWSINWYPVSYRYSKLSPDWGIQGLEQCQALWKALVTWQDSEARGEKSRCLGTKLGRGHEPYWGRWSQANQRRGQIRFLVKTFLVVHPCSTNRPLTINLWCSHDCLSLSFLICRVQRVTFLVQCPAYQLLGMSLLSEVLYSSGA